MAIKVKHGYSLLGHNTFGMQVAAREFIAYDTIGDLKTVLQSMPAHEPMLHIGQGSNLLFTKDFEGTVLHSRIRFIDLKPAIGGTVCCRVGSGVAWDDFCQAMAQRDIFGTENLSDIPGEVGAAAVQNIGAYGVEASDIISTVEALEVATGRERVFSVEECRYGYRDSIFKNELWRKYVVTAVNFRLSTLPRPQLDYGQLKELAASGRKLTASGIREAVVSIREAKLPNPAVLGSAGSFFKNPVVAKDDFEKLQAQYPDAPHYALDSGKVKVPAAWLIEQCGWKGKAVGGAAVYGRQPLIIVNQGHATPADVMTLASAIVQSVVEKFHIDLHPEVNYI